MRGEKTVLSDNHAQQIPLVFYQDSFVAKAIALVKKQIPYQIVADLFERVELA